MLALTNWQPNALRQTELSFTVGRIVLNCAAGIPLLGDLTALRAATRQEGLPATFITPKVPVDMALDHTLSVDYHGTRDALRLNMALEVERNEERFAFVKWALDAYPSVRLLPPGSGILHQLNLEYFAPGLLSQDDVYYPDTLVGTDSHTGMIAGLGSLGWGVGGIEALAALLGLPVTLCMPDVIGVNLTGRLPPGATATDLVLQLTARLRQLDLVGKFVEFHGEGVSGLSIPDRATLANMAPEYGATVGYFPVDAQTVAFLRQTGRREEMARATESYYRLQGCFGEQSAGAIDYTATEVFDLTTVEPCVAGPRRPQDYIPLPRLRSSFNKLMQASPATGGYARETQRSSENEISDGTIVIAAITSCTNTANPGLMLAAGLVARKAVTLGLRASPWVKTSLAPGSRVVGKYLADTGLQSDLDQLGFATVGYGCTTCFGASGPLDARLEQSITLGDVVTCAVLSGNRNFEGRIHPSVRAAYLMSPPLVVAFAIAGRIDIDMTADPLGEGTNGSPIYLKDVWPTSDELAAVAQLAGTPEQYLSVYSDSQASDNPFWDKVPSECPGTDYTWRAESTYLREPPFLAHAFRASGLRPITSARALLVLGDHITTDHISPIGAIPSDSSAGRYLRGLGVRSTEFNNYGSRRMNHEVMVRGMFSNARLRNHMTPGREGGVTVHQPSGEIMDVHAAAERYVQTNTALIVFAGAQYGTGSARDWAAKGTRLLGVRAVVAASFERIHRSNLVGMGILPCELPAGMCMNALGLDGSEVFDLLDIDAEAQPGQSVTLIIHRSDGSQDCITLTLRLETRSEIDYVRAGGIMPFMFSHAKCLPN